MRILAFPVGNAIDVWQMCLRVTFSRHINYVMLSALNVVRVSTPMLTAASVVLPWCATVLLCCAVLC